eukprot:gnl/TRDRNA2_/TRDRNA2_198316_c0_seq1.p1 gnl/TRDRNA2_/TRDRNA2_198316_c0~~gnl/TRDRNA2_/TRDRNA2_198316_c0_seq1.p1  ORF type:complete len:234 (+),score=22.60 gnl/TRDRNA2_/TRDRNA2_198316_c0_seq1:56-703(+)
MAVARHVAVIILVAWHAAIACVQIAGLLPEEANPRFIVEKSNGLLYLCPAAIMIHSYYLKSVTALQTAAVTTFCFHCALSIEYLVPSHILLAALSFAIYWLVAKVNKGNEKLRKVYDLSLVCLVAAHLLSALGLVGSFSFLPECDYLIVATGWRYFSYAVTLAYADFMGSVSALRSAVAGALCFHVPCILSFNPVHFLMSIGLTFVFWQAGKVKK